MVICVLDVETTGLEDNSEVCEISAALYCCRSKKVLAVASTLLRITNNPAEDINGIKPSDSELLSANYIVNATHLIGLMTREAKFVVAYNSDFDKSYLDKLGGDRFKTDNFADAQLIRYPKKPRFGSSLVSVAVANGVTVKDAHRATGDVLLLCELLGTVDDLESEVIRAAQPKVTVKAFLSYEQRQLAKDAGFIWNGIVQGCWAKKVLESEANEFPFETEIVNE